MTPPHWHTPVLYAAAGVLLAAGTVWWVRADPVPAEDPRTARMRTAVERALPDAPAGLQIHERTLVVPPGREVDSAAGAGDGTFRVNLACGGTGRLRIRFSEGSTVIDDSGLRAGTTRALTCAPNPASASYTLEVQGQAGLSAALQDTGSEPVVLRWTMLTMDGG